MESLIHFTTSPAGTLIIVLAGIGVSAFCYAMWLVHDYNQHKRHGK